MSGSRDLQLGLRMQGRDETTATVWAEPDAAVPPIYLVGSRMASWHIWPLDGSQDWREHHDVPFVAADRPGP